MLDKSYEPKYVEQRLYEAWEQSLHPEDKVGATEALQYSIEHETDFNNEFRVLWPDGSTHYLAAHAKLFKNELGEVERIVGTNSDITDKKRLTAAGEASSGVPKLTSNTP